VGSADVAKPVILTVDDDPIILNLVFSALKDDYTDYAYGLRLWITPMDYAYGL